MHEDEEVERNIDYLLAEAEFGDEIDQVRYLRMAQKLVEEHNLKGTDTAQLVNYYKKEFGIECED